MFDKKDSLVGQPAPDIRLVDQNGQEWSMPREGKVVLFFFPAAYTSGCTAEMCSIRDSPLAELASVAPSTSPDTPPDVTSAASVTLVGISKDSPEKLHKWAESLKLPPGMVFLSDPGGRIGKEYGVGSAFLGLATTRKTVIVDNGVVTDTYVANVGVKSHAGWVEKHLNTS